MQKILFLGLLLVFAGCTSPSETQSTVEPEPELAKEYHFVANLTGDVALLVNSNVGMQQCTFTSAATGQSEQTGTNFFVVTKSETGTGLSTTGGGNLVHAQVGPIDSDVGSGSYSSASSGPTTGNVTHLIAATNIGPDSFGFVENGSIAFSLECPQSVAMPTLAIGTFIHADPAKATAAVGASALLADTNTAAGVFTGDLNFDHTLFTLAHAGTGMAGRIHMESPGFSGQYTIPVMDNIWKETSSGVHTMTLAYEFAGTFDIFVAAAVGANDADLNAYLADDSAINIDF